MLQERRIDYSFDGLNNNNLHTIDIIWGSFIYRGLLIVEVLRILVQDLIVFVLFTQSFPRSSAHVIRVFLPFVAYL